MLENSTGWTAIFDLDGTLVDSALDLVPSLNRTIATHGVPPIAYDQVHKMVGQGGRAMIQRAYALNNQHIDDHLLDELLPRFFAEYEANITENTKFYQGCLSALDQLSTAGWTLAVCTNKHERLAKMLLSGLGELDRFAAITGGDTFDFKKPDPGHLVKTAEQAGGCIENSVMIGDSSSDIHAANAAQIPVIAVDFGYTDIPVADLKPDAVISHFDELVDVVSSLSKRDIPGAGSK